MKWVNLFTIIISLSLFTCGKPKSSITVYLSILPQEQAKYIKLIKEFKRETGIDVNLIAQQYGEIRRTLEAEVRAGKGVVDIIELDVYYLNSLAPFVYDLTPYEKRFKKEKIYPDAWKAGIINNKLLFIPHRLSWQALIYNSKYIPHPPRTWEELLDIAERYPKKVGLKASLYEGLTCDILPFIWQAGGEPLNFKSPGSIEAMRFLEKLIPYLNPQSRTYKENTILEAQAREEIYLHFNWPFAVTYLKDKGLLPNPNRTAMLPKGPKGYATVLGGGYLAISKVAPHPKEAIRFLEFITSSRVQKWLVENLGWMPIREDGWEGLTQENKELYQGYIEMAPYVKARPSVPEYEKVSRGWQEAFHRIMEGEPADSVIKRLSHQDK